MSSFPYIIVVFIQFYKIKIDDSTVISGLS